MCSAYYICNYLNKVSYLPNSAISGFYLGSNVAKQTRTVSSMLKGEKNQT